MLVSEAGKEGFGVQTEKNTHRVIDFKGVLVSKLKMYHPALSVTTLSE